MTSAVGGFLKETQFQILNNSRFTIYSINSVLIPQIFFVILCLRLHNNNQASIKTFQPAAIYIGYIEKL